MSDERMKILELIQNGKISASEGLELLKAMDDGNRQPSGTIENVGHILHIRVITGQNNTKVNVNLPLSLFKVATKFANIGLKVIPEDARQEMLKKGIDLTQINFDELSKLIDQGLVDGKLVDIDTEDEKSGRTKVEIYVE
ncbi:MAG: hypothetical protein H6Q73_3085 [Firmicutes bacterium]|nr:hypothetical protein [Bacillota bacterium]